MKKLFLFFALIVGLLTSASTLQAQVNMSRYITLTVTNGAAIKLDLLAAAAGTPVRIVSGSNTQNITVGTSWYGTTSYTAGSTEMKVYGDIIGFDCSYNGANLTALDVSHNTQLRKLYCRDNSLSSLNVSKNTELKGLYCYGNSFSTSALDDIYCALPVRSASDNAEIVPVESTSAPNHATVIATNAQNATAKNWKVLYSNNSADITTTGSYVCPQLNMSSYIILTVTNGAAIKLDLLAAADGTPVRIVSGSNTQDITVGNSWYNGNNPSTYTVTASASTMTIYGDLMGFACEYNGANLTALDPSHNTQLTALYCNNNNLSSLDVSRNTKLKVLCCNGNDLSTQTLDDIYCALPDRTSETNGVIQPVYSDTSSNHAIVLATNKANAIAKNWKVQYYKNDADIPATTGSYVCPAPEPNMNSYITLTVTNGAAIKLNFKAAAEGTPVRIVSGSNTQDITVGTSWYGTATYTADGTTMTIYGDIIGFGCNDNRANLTALDPSQNTQLKVLECLSNQLAILDVSQNTQLEKLYCQGNTLTSLDVSKNTQLILLNCYSNTLSSLDVSKNTQLQELYCHSNNFSTAALDDIYCALPDRTGKESGAIQPVYSDTSSNHAIVLATNKANAIAKNWKVQYYADDTDIPATTGSYVCSGAEPNMSRYITLTVANGAAIKLDFKAAAAATPVRIVSGSNTQNITVGTNWTGITSYTANASTMTIYGDLIGFDCQKNGANLTALDPSHNTQLTELYCGENTLSSLDVSKNTQLTRLDCQYNKLSSLDVSKNTQLTWLYCYNNTLGNLDVSKNTQLDMLDCSSNTLSSLDVSHNTQLTRLDCSSNTLSSLDVSKNTQLQKLICHGNKFSAQALDDIYCALPDRTSETNGVIQPVYSDTSSNHAIVLATNKANAIAKNWNVQYYKNNSDIPATTGKHKCSATDIAEASAEPALTLYPNPVADVLYLSATARTVRIYNIYGIEVAHATDTDRVEVSHLPAGVYTVKADGTVAKMVKR